MPSRARLSQLRRPRPGRKGPPRHASETESPPAHASKLPLFLQKDTPVTQPGDAVEQEADHIAADILSGRSAEPEGGETTTRKAGSVPGSTSDQAGSGSGQPLPPGLQADAEHRLGRNLDAVRLHDDPEAQRTAALLGAQAFTHGNDIWLGPGASASDRGLLAHELAHVDQQPDAIARRSATWLERRAWLGFFNHYLPRKFLNNYMDDTGNPITLSPQEMIDVNARVNIQTSPAFRTELTALSKQAAASSASGTAVPAIKYIEVNGPGQAMTNGTLGNFTITYKGMLTVMADGTWTFIGIMTFYDVWDFDPKPFGTSGRSTAGELKTRVAAEFLPGSSFEIFSVAMPVTQVNTDARTNWSGGTPTFVNDRSAVAGSDIGAGDVGGAEVSGPEVGGGDVEVGGAGGEIGAQSAEDLN